MHFIPRHRRTFATLLALPLIAAGVCTLGSTAAQAQEDNISAPPPLQFPTLPGPNPTGSFGLGSLRSALEQGGNTELCKILTKQVNPNAVFPPNFTFAQCDPAIAAKVNSRSGSVRWASGARPRECGNCVGRPSNTRTQALDRPNRRFATVHARLTFTVVDAGPTPFDRDVIFPVDVNFECRVAGAQKRGEIQVTSVVGQPFADEPGFGESVADFLLGPLNISRSIENGIRAALGGGGSTPGPNLGPCTSIGARLDQSPAFDSFVWDIPGSQTLPPITTTHALPGSEATVVFDSIVRKPTIESQPPTGPFQFVLFVNGNTALIPRIGTVALPPGGRHDQRYCKTITVANAEALQILVTDGVGGAAWSQFPRGVDFGNGPSRTITTGRQFFQAPNPIPGAPTPPGGGKPQSFFAREFEVRYHVVFSPGVVAQPTTTGGGPLAGTHPPLGGGVSTTTGTGSPPPPACIKI